MQWVEKVGAVCGAPGWRMPPRPLQRTRSPDSHDGDVDDLGRSSRREPSAERDELPKTRTRRGQKRARRAAAAAENGEEDEEAVWRRTLRQAADSENAANAEATAGGAAPRHPRAMGPAGEALLPNWYRAEDGEGRVYYHNRATLEVRAGIII